MQFILSEEEYKKLIHKDRIKQPVDEFVAAVTKQLKHYGEYGTPGIESPLVTAIKTSLQTLSIKLDL
jgi:hypothetical protein